MSNLIEKLNARIRAKVTPEVIARAEKMATVRGPDIQNQMMAFSHQAAAKRVAEAEVQTAGMRM
jgi:hypothetical protein